MGVIGALRLIRFVSSLFQLLSYAGAAVSSACRLECSGSGSGLAPEAGRALLDELWCLVVEAFQRTAVTGDAEDAVAAMEGLLPLMAELRDRASVDGMDGGAHIAAEGAVKPLTATAQAGGWACLEGQLRWFRSKMAGCSSGGALASSALTLLHRGGRSLMESSLAAQGSTERIVVSGTEVEGSLFRGRDAEIASRHSLDELETVFAELALPLIEELACHKDFVVQEVREDLGGGGKGRRGFPLACQPLCIHPPANCCQPPFLPPETSPPETSLSFFRPSLLICPSFLQSSLDPRRPIWRPGS